MPFIVYSVCAAHPGRAVWLVQSPVGSYPRRGAALQGFSVRGENVSQAAL